MNSATLKRSRLPARSRLPTLLKRARKATATLQFALRRPPVALLAFLTAAAALLGLVHLPSRRDFASFGPAGSGGDGTRDAFSPHASFRMHDQAAVVQGDVRAMGAVARVAYFVQVGNDSVHLLPRLFSRLHHPRNLYVVHVDTKVDAARRAEVEAIVAGSEAYRLNVHMLPSEMVTYKAVSMVTNTLAAMTLALEKDADWDYFINLSGADYPLLAPQAQAELLARPRVPAGRLNFITFFPRKEWTPYSFRIRNLHWDPAAVGFQSATSRLRLLRDLKENPLEPHRAFVFTKAEAWMILSRPFVKFLVRSAFAKRMLLNHAHVLSVPEHYFSDVLYNHPFWRTTIVPDAMRKVVWYLKNRRAGQHPYVLDGGSTMFSLWGYIAETRSLFARKFSVADSPLMDRIDREMSGAGLADGDEAVRGSEKEHKIFYRRLEAHFDHITKKTLAEQGYPYPRNAYPLDTASRK